MEKEKILSMLKERKQELLGREKQLKKLMRNAPKGSIRAIQKGKASQFYFRETRDQKNGTYIKKKDQSKAIKIIQYEYWKKAYEQVKKELLQMEKNLQFFMDGTFEDVYMKMPAPKRKWIDPLIETDEQLISKFMDREFEPLVINGENVSYTTDRGEHVRSKSELLIANALYKAGIPYLYEMPLYLEAKGEYVRPDFTILNVRKRKEVYWEHLGIMSNPDYAEKNVSKLNQYQLSGYGLGEKLIITMETERNPLNMKVVQCFIDKILQE